MNFDNFEHMRRQFEELEEKLEGIVRDIMKNKYDIDTKGMDKNELAELCKDILDGKQKKEEKFDPWRDAYFTEDDDEFQEKLAKLKKGEIFDEIEIEVECDCGFCNEKDMSFGEAIEHLEAGNKVKRKGWGGYWFIDEAVVMDEEEMSDARMIVAKLKDGGYAPAQPYQADILAKDWEVVK